jgi:hypothetical protein
MKRYTVSGAIVMSKDLIFGDAEKMDAPEDRSISVELAKQKLRDLEASKSSEPTVELTQKDYQQRIERMHNRLESAWAANGRVVALKIAIQCSKLISGQTSVPQFYPSMFAMCSAILDSFGKRVFERLRSKADSDSRRMGTGALPADFTAGDVGSATREIARNWLYKTACIRELVPRLYLELALLECYRFLGADDYPALLTRLAHTCRGIGDPLVAAYARFYLAKQASRLVSGRAERACVWLCLQDQLNTWSLVGETSRLSLLERLGVSEGEYVDLFAPPLSWLCSQVAWRAPVGVFGRVMSTFRGSCGSPVALTAILDAFDGTHTAGFLRDIVPLIKAAAAKPSKEPAAADMYRALCEGLCGSLGPAAADKMPLLNEAWSAISKVADPECFVRCAAPIVSMVRRHYEEEQLLVVLRVIAKRMRKAAKESGEAEAAAAAASSGAGDDSAEAAAAAEAGASAGGEAVVSVRKVPTGCMPHLDRVLVALVSGTSGSTAVSPSIITSDAFVSLMDLFGGSRKADVSRRMLQAFVVANQPTSDPVLVHTLMDMARSVHDSLDRASGATELRVASELCSRLVELTDFGRDLERQLQLLTEARQSFTLFDGTKKRLCLAAVRLTRRALRLVKGRHSRKTGTFMRAAFAFLHITIPALSDTMERLTVYCISAESALCNDCAPQADALLTAALEEFGRLGTAPDTESDSMSPSASPPASTARAGSGASQSAVEQLVGRLSGAIVMAPGHPESGPFHLLRSLADHVRRYPFDPLGAGKGRCLLQVLRALAAMSQASLPYNAGAGGADGNDVLYAGDPAFEDEIAELWAELVEELMAFVADLSEVSKEASDAGAVGEQFRGIVLELADTLITHADMSKLEAAATAATAA